MSKVTKQDVELLYKVREMLGISKERTKLSVLIRRLEKPCTNIEISDEELEEALKIISYSLTLWPDKQEEQLNALNTIKTKSAELEKYKKYALSVGSVQSGKVPRLQAKIAELEHGIEMCNSQAKVQHEQDMKRITQLKSRIKELETTINKNPEMSILYSLQGKLVRRTQQLDKIRETVGEYQTMNYKTLGDIAVHKIKSILEGDEE